MRQLIINDVITVEFIRTFQNLNDPLMKGLPRDLVTKTANEMGLQFTLDMVETQLYIH